MDCSLGSKPMFCFEVQKVIEISDHGTYRVQWAPAWVSKFHLVGCEHLIEEFLQQQKQTVKESEHNTLSLKPTEPSFDLLIGNSHDEQAQLEINSTVSQESMEESHFHGKERNASFDKLISYSRQYSEPSICYDVKPDIYTDVDQGATKQSLSSGEDLTHQFESPEEPILDTVAVKLEPNEDVEGEISLSNDFNTRYEAVGSHDCVSNNNPDVNERTNSQSVDYTSPLHAEMYEANLQSVPDEMCPKARDLDIIDRENQTCSKTASDDSNSKLERHHGTHTGFKRYPFSHCSYTTSQESCLTNHITTHSSGKPYACDVCQKTFARTELLKVHKRIHNNEKPYTCSTCGKSFTQSSTLKTHLLTHTKDKPHKCDQCGKCFTQTSHLKVHIRTHTGEKPYSCQTCGKTFAASSNLNRHNLHCTSASTRKENS